MYPDSSEGLNKETEEGVYFFTPSFYALDNFSAHQIEIWGRKFATTEHAYQWKKFAATEPEIAEQILSAGSPEAVKRISEGNKNKQPETWHGDRVNVMEEILIAKAAQHQDLQETLKRSGKRKIVENSPVDGFWGAGPDGNGENTVGKIWMKIREKYL